MLSSILLLYLLPVLRSCVKLTVSALTTVRQLHVVTRHGSRYPLEKNANNLSEATAGTLTATGEKQMYDVGVWLRNKYEYTGLFSQYKPAYRLESSSFQRTIVSANALALGLFNEKSRDPFEENSLPGNLTRPNVPVYTTEVDNDVTLRAYDKCDEFHERLDKLYSSAEWQKLESEHSPLLASLAQMPAFVQFSDPDKAIVPLKNLWNVFDKMVVAQTECGTIHQTATCTKDLLPSSDNDHISQEQWEEIQTLAHSAELMKYTDEMAGKLIGGNLLRKILGRMLDDVGNEAQFFLYSAHYSTILGLFAALGEKPVDTEVIPGYGAALIFALEQREMSNKGETVSILYKAGDSTESIELSCNTATDGPCELRELSSYVRNNFRIEDWCRACGSHGALCARTDDDQPNTKATAAACANELNRPGFAGVLGGFFAGVLVMTLLFGWFLRYWKKRINTTNCDHQNNIELVEPSLPQATVT